MIERFRTSALALFDSSQPLLLAVSGGVDSSVMCHLVHAIHQPFAIAHCNFHLRPDECDRDETFVQSLAQRYRVDYYVAHFATEEYASQHSLSIEEAARNLRYTFFAEILQGKHQPKLVGGQPVADGVVFKPSVCPQLIATAHHRDDATETFFINLLRGSGIMGLHGIRSQKGNVVRPLLSFSRNDIITYARQNGIAYVVDSTNASDAYLRNKIRHQLMPLLRRISPQVDEMMQANISRFSEVEKLYREQVRYQLRSFELDPSGVNRIDIAQMRALNPQRTLLFELLKSFHFTPVLIDQLMPLINSDGFQPGRQLFSSTHRLLIDRTQVFISPLPASKTDEVLQLSLSDCLASADALQPPFPRLRFSQLETLPGSLRLPKNQALFDCSQLHFPLILRRWHQGDRFLPFGMKGSQLVSDFFSNQKFSLLEKEKAWILTDSDNRILWIVGYRTSDIAKVTPSTSSLLFLTLE